MNHHASTHAKQRMVATGGRLRPLSGSVFFRGLVTMSNLVQVNNAHTDKEIVPLRVKANCSFTSLHIKEYALIGHIKLTGQSMHAIQLKHGQTFSGDDGPCLLFVAGGCYNGFCDIEDTEIVDLCSDGVNTCSAPPFLPDDTMVIEGVSLRTPEGNPLFCSSEDSAQTCLEYVPESGSWMPGPDMMGNRVGSAVAELPNDRFWILSGNQYGDQYSTEYYEDNTFISGPRITDEGYDFYPCAVQISDDLTFFANGASYIYSAERGTFETTNEQMLFPSKNSACGAATTADGSRIVVLAGGFDTPLSSLVQILDVSTETWTFGPDLPTSIYSARTVQTPKSFLIVGGRSRVTNDYSDAILEFDPVNYGWIVRNETLALARRGFYMIDVDKDRFC